MRTIFLLLVLAAPATGRADGYVYRDGYYWQGAAAFSRSQVKVYTGPGCYYYRYDYHPVPVKVIEKITERIVEKPVYPPAVAVAPPKGWREQLLDAALARDKAEQELKAKAQDHKEYIEAINALGLNRGIAIDFGYTYNTSTSTYGPNAAQGNTVYGYSLSSVSSVLGDNQVGVWMQQAARAQAAAQTTAEKGLGGILSAIDLEGSNRARVASILAKAEVLKSLDREEAHTQTRVEVQGALPPDGTLPPAPAVGKAEALGALFAAKCAACHSQQGTFKGVPGSTLFPQGVDLGLYSGFTFEQRKRVLEVVLDDSMPKGDDPLTYQEKALIMADVLSVEQAARKDD